MAWFFFGGGHIYTGLMNWEQLLCFFGGFYVFAAHVFLATVVAVATVLLQGLCCVRGEEVLHLKRPRYLSSRRRGHII